MLSWAVTINRKFKRKNEILVVFAFSVITTIVVVKIINDRLVDANKRSNMLRRQENVAARRAAERKIFCNKPAVPTNMEWETVRDWDYQHYIRPHFLNNFKNPCFLTNTSGHGNSKLPYLSAGHLRLQCLPYFLIAGFPKCATTDLWNRLFSHPDIRLRHQKELRFFNKMRFDPGRFDYAVSKYAQLFDKAADDLQRIVSPVECQEKPFPYHHGITGEGTVDAVFDNPKWYKYPGNEFCTEPVITNADYVHQINPNIKVIFLVRNPTERLYSDYIFEARYIKYKTGIQLFHDAVVDTMKKHAECREHHSIRACAYNDTIEDYKIRFRVGMYNIFISDWVERFSKENVLVIKSEDTTGAKMSATYKRILQFLDIRPFTRLEELLIFKRPHANVRLDKEAKIGEMLPETRELIDKFYEPFNKKLAELYPDIDYNK